MASLTRQHKFSRLIQKEISMIFQRDHRGFLHDTMISVVDVKVSPDFSVAKIYISMMLAKDKNAILERLNNNKKEIRKELGNRIAKQVRIIPELVFIIDEVEENAQRIESLIKSLNIPPAPAEDNT